MIKEQIVYQTGIPEKHREAAVELYDQAFGKKLCLAVKSKQARQQIFKKGFALKYAIGAISPNGLLGIAGIHAADGSLTGGITFRDFVSRLGLFKGVRAAAVFSFYDSKPKPGELLIDGIAVRSDARGMGVGSALLNEVRAHAKLNGYNRVRLDVIDTNPRAQKLYQRFGFVAVQKDRFPYLKRVLGFGGATTMTLKV